MGRERIRPARGGRVGRQTYAGSSGWIKRNCRHCRRLCHSVALDGEGNVWTWGRNDFGQLGDGTKTNRFVPAKVAGIGG
ncbi:hypothetical protein [Cohnella faecalis]